MWVFINDGHCFSQFCDSLCSGFPYALRDLRLCWSQALTSVMAPHCFFFFLCAVEKTLQKTNHLTPPWRSKIMEHLLLQEMRQPCSRPCSLGSDNCPHIFQRTFTECVRPARLCDSGCPFLQIPAFLFHSPCFGGQAFKLFLLKSSLVKCGWHRS